MDNLARLAQALKRLDARIRTEQVEDDLPFDTSAEALRGLRLLDLTTRFGDLDLTFEPSGTGGYRDLSEHAVDRQIGAVRVRIAALADVIRSKEAAGRDKDLRGLVELRRVLKAHQSET